MGALLKDWMEKDEAMKINLILIIATTVGTLGIAGIAVAEQTNKTPGVTNSKGLAMDDSEN